VYGVWWLGEVIGRTDGDKINSFHDGQYEKIRLWGIDCPENNQDFGTKAKRFSSILVFAKAVEVESLNIDRYGWTKVLVRMGDTLVKRR
jgi:micrococcal nuclease